MTTDRSGVTGRVTFYLRVACRRRLRAGRTAGAVRGHVGVEVKAARDGLRSDHGETGTQVVVSEDARQAGAEGGDVTRRADQRIPTVLQVIAQPADERRHDGDARGQGLENRQGKRFVVRGLDEDICCAQHTRRVGRWPVKDHLARQVCGGEGARRRPGIERMPGHVRPNDRQRGARRDVVRQGPPRGQEFGQALLTAEPPEKEDDQAVRRPAERPPGRHPLVRRRRSKALGVNAVWDVMDSVRRDTRRRGFPRMFAGDATDRGGAAMHGINGGLGEAQERSQHPAARWRPSGRPNSAGRRALQHHGPADEPAGQHGRHRQIPRRSGR